MNENTATAEPASYAHNTYVYTEQLLVPAENRAELFISGVIDHTDITWYTRRTT